jgi:hypothetical protein
MQTPHTVSATHVASRGQNNERTDDGQLWERSKHDTSAETSRAHAVAA